MTPSVNQEGKNMADMQDLTILKAGGNQVDALRPVKAIKVFAEGLTERIRQLDKLEREWKISPQMSTEILNGMIENFVWTVLQTLRRQDEVNDLAKIDPKTIEQLLKSDILTHFNPTPQGGCKRMSKDAPTNISKKGNE